MTEKALQETDHVKKGDEPLALVLGGGGAHAAYQVGFLRSLARHFPNLEIPILTGVSAGAINAVFLANHRGSFRSAVDDLVTLWQELTIDRVFKTNPLSLLRNLLHWQLSLVSGGLVRSPTERGLVDSEPLRSLLEEVFSEAGGAFRGIEANLSRGSLRAVAVTATDYRTDRAVTWVQGTEFSGWERPHRFSREATLGVDHIMASTALPLFFRAVRVDGDWFGDGGMRQTSPLAPALHLGAGRILAVSTRHRQSGGQEQVGRHPDHPPPAQVVGTLLGSIFLDLLVQDARNLERINCLVRQAAESDSDPCGLREIHLFLLQPSRQISKLSGELRHHLPGMFNYLLRGLGTHRIISPDWLSLVMFDADYLQRLIDIGEEDAEERLEELGEFLETKSA